MKKISSIILFGSFCLVVAACGGKASAKSVAQKWCDLNAKVHNATDGGPDYEKAKEARDKYEKDMEAKYGKDKAFMDEVGKEVEACEDASEGRK